MGIHVKQIGRKLILKVRVMHLFLLCIKLLILKHISKITLLKHRFH
jgi:hypothetical protein